MLANTPEMVECHFGVPMTGGVLNTLNTRLDAEAIAFMLEHGEAKVLHHRHRVRADDRARRSRARDRSRSSSTSSMRSAPAASCSANRDYETFIADGDPDFAWQPPADEWNAIALNYTSGTTGNPKGVVYHHRGAYLNALSNIVDWGMPRHSVYLWTLPMFHCNGWCFPWTMAANAGTNVCLRKVEAARDPRCDPRRTGHALLRRADRPRDADQRARRVEGGHRASGQLPGRGGGAAGGGDRRHGADGLRHHARLRPHRNLRTGRGVREAARSGTRSTSARAPSATAARACAIRARKA